MKQFVLPHSGVMSAARTSVATASIGLVGGIGLQTVTSELVLITPLLVAMPAINAMAGDYATVVTAHIGDPEMSRGSVKKLARALAISLPISAFGVVGLSMFLGAAQGYQINQAFVLTYGGFVLGSLSGVVGITVLASVLLNRVLVSRMVNSDDVLIPVSNVIASVLILLSIAVAAWRIF